jgi:hypothetical protein
MPTLPRIPGLPSTYLPEHYFNTSTIKDSSQVTSTLGQSSSSSSGAQPARPKTAPTTFTQVQDTELAKLSAAAQRLPPPARKAPPPPPPPPPRRKGAKRPKTQKEKDEEGTGPASGSLDRQYQHIHTQAGHDGDAQSNDGSGSPYFWYIFFFVLGLVCTLVYYLSAGKRPALSWPSQELRVHYSLPAHWSSTDLWTYPWQFEDEEGDFLSHYDLNQAISKSIACGGLVADRSEFRVGKSTRQAGRSPTSDLLSNS